MLWRVRPCAFWFPDFALRLLTGYAARTYSVWALRAQGGKALRGAGPGGQAAGRASAECRRACPPSVSELARWRGLASRGGVLCPSTADVLGHVIAWRPAVCCRVLAAALASAPGCLHTLTHTDITHLWQRNLFPDVAGAPVGQARTPR